MARAICTALLLQLIPIPTVWAAPRSVDEIEAERLRGVARDQASRKEYRYAAETLETVYRLDWSRPETLKDIAVMLGADGRIDQAVARYRQYLALVPDDAPAFLAMANTLSWSKNKYQLEESERLFTQYLQAHPDSDEAFLQRARVRSWIGSDAAVPDFRAYLAKHPDPSVKLELAMALSAHRDAAAFAEAIAIYEEHLRANPTDLAILLQRARVKSWAGRTPDAIADYVRYLESKPEDEDARRELARLNAQTARPPPPPSVDVQPPDPTARLLQKANATGVGPDPASAIPLFDAYLARHPEDRAARARRARVLLWAGRYARAENELVELRRIAESDAEKNEIETDLARLYAQTGRRYRALEVLDVVLARTPADAEATKERDRLEIYAGTRLEPRLFLYEDKSKISIRAVTLEGRTMIGRNFGVIADVGWWSLGNALERLAAGRANLGVWTRYRSLELEGAAGPRVYEVFSPKAGGRVAARVVPTSWFNAAAKYQYDDIYVDMLQPGSIAAGIRGHAAQVTGDLTLPVGWPMRVVGVVGTHFLLPSNRSIETMGTVFVPVIGPLSVGYNVQYLAWRYNDPSYWSPQAFAAHLGVVRWVQQFPRLGLAYDLQGLAGVAGERVEGIPEAGFGRSFGGSGVIMYSPTPRLELRAGAQYAQTIRELPRPVLGGTSTTSVTPTTKTPSIYWWTTANLSVTLYL